MHFIWVCYWSNPPRRQFSQHKLMNILAVSLHSVLFSSPLVFSVAFLFPRDLVWPQVLPYYIFNVLLLLLLLKNSYPNEIFSKHRLKVIIFSCANMNLKTMMKPDRTQVIWFFTHKASYLYLYSPATAFPAVMLFVGTLSSFSVSYWPLHSLFSVYTTTFP